MRIPDFTPCWPGLESSLHLESSDRRALFRKRSVPSLRASLHLGPMYRATFFSSPETLDPAPLRRPAAVMRHGCDVRDAGDLEAERVQSAHGRFAPRAGAFDPHFQVLHPALLRRATRCFGRYLRGEGRPLARALEPGAARSGPT